ncbi:MAG: hypothetical protein IT383_17065 [Deltaproteobacteria bacterium]|nr:hypothetical protein [Deltaproteobacteria bacterium]
MSCCARVHTILKLLVLAVASLGGMACEVFDSAECHADADCGAARVCAAGQCVACADNADCGAGQFCCGGECRAESEIDRRCGCGPSTGGNPGVDCTAIEPAGLCLAGGVTAGPDTVSQGSCGCGCSAAEGGPICGAPDEPGQAALCSCAENGDCRTPSVDAAGRPHRSTDTCNPSSKCVCYATSAPSTSCGPDGPAPDCSDTGCVNLLESATDCGVAGRNCLEAATSVDGGGSCVEGGCTCDHEDDCAGANLNVDTCVFIGGSARCVCSGYTRAGTQAPCPMAIACAGAAGCSLDGASYTSEEALRAAFGLP